MRSVRFSQTMNLNENRILPFLLNLRKFFCLSFVHISCTWSEMQQIITIGKAKHFATLCNFLYSPSYFLKWQYEKSWKEPSEGHPAQSPAESKADCTDQVAPSPVNRMFLGLWQRGLTAESLQVCQSYFSILHLRHSNGFKAPSSSCEMAMSLQGLCKPQVSCRPSSQLKGILRLL